MSVNLAVHSAGDERRSRRPLAALFVGVAIVSAIVVAGIAFWSASRVPPEFRVSSLYIEPDPPLAGEEVVVTAIVAGNVSPDTVQVDFAFKAFFGDTSGAIGSMSSVGNHRFQARLGPFTEGSEVWVVASGLAPVVGRTFPETLSFSVGEVLRGGPSALNIPGFSWSAGTSDGLNVSILAQVLSDAQVMEVVVAIAVWGENDEAFLQGAMVDRGDGRYEATFTVASFRAPGFVALRMAAVDASGNTAVRQASSGLPG